MMNYSDAISVGYVLNHISYHSNDL